MMNWLMRLLGIGDLPDVEEWTLEDSYMLSVGDPNRDEKTMFMVDSVELFGMTYEEASKKWKEKGGANAN